MTVARRRRWLLWIPLLLGLLAAATAAVGTWLYRELGRSPGELLDYVDHRLLGHPKLEALAAGPIGALRDAFDAPSAAERLRTPFEVPPPPPRRGPADIAPAEPVPAGAKVLRVGRSGDFPAPSAVARLAQDGDIVEIEAGDYRGDVALWEQKRLTIRGVGGAARLFADGQSAEGKAIWVIRNGQFDISNIDFVGARVSDGNGAGIRFEAGRLHVRDCLFWDNQMGLLTGGGPGPAADAVLEVQGSEFAYSHVDGRWGHNLYVGALASVTVRGIYSHHAGRGHLLKSRARRSEVMYSRFSDETGGRASYELDFPNGGVVRVLGNVLQQQPGTDNSAMIAYGEEGYAWPENRLAVASNTLVNDLPHGGSFIFAAPGAQQLVSANNLLVGPGVQRAKGLQAFNDQHADWGALERPGRQDWRPRAGAPGLGWREPPAELGGAALVPRAAYRHPRAVQPLDGPPRTVGGLPAPPP